MERKLSGRREVNERYTQWKALVPLLYDWFANHNLFWPSLSCRWGPQVEQEAYKSRQRLYLSELTDAIVPSALVIATCEIVKPRFAAAEHISQFNEEASSPFVKKLKTILHPGEVNRIRELPQNSNILGTHTDSPDVLIWDIEAQPDHSANDNAPGSSPDLILSGHSENAEFALAMCPSEPLVLSGGKDKKVVLWSIQDHISSLAVGSSTKIPGSASTLSCQESTIGNSPKVAPRGIFSGHENTVEDVQFCSRTKEFCSVADDSRLILWDARFGTTPAVKVEKAHHADILCVDWNPHDENFILTGSADNTVHMFDRRRLQYGGVGAPVYKFKGHKAPVLCVQWSPDSATVFGSSAEDGLLNVWDYEKVNTSKTTFQARMHNSPPGLFFQHAGHRDRVVDFQWSSANPWTIVSVSDDSASVGRGGTLQIWRMLDLIYWPDQDAFNEISKFRNQILCAEKLCNE